MIDTIFEFLSSALSGSSFTAVFASFGWGIVSVLLSPCHLSSIPLVVGFINSQGEITMKRTFTISLVFGAGILITIALIGIITALAGRLMGDVGAVGNYFVAAVFFIVGLYLMDIIKLPWDGASIKPTRQKGVFAALILGLLFGIGLGPCTFAYMAPVLGVVFQVAKTNIIYSVILLFAFGIGHILVIVAAGTLTKKVQQYLNWTEKSKAATYIKRICGVLVILGGIYMIYNTY
ncbi:MAG: sulfite exporter TauE/SafE family protein [Ignavibacteriae bacterium]|nr:sulfite exporter TauE/SafE family protein [Ignavibacteriota bacterium]